MPDDLEPPTTSSVSFVRFTTEGSGFKYARLSYEGAVAVRVETANSHAWEDWAGVHADFGRTVEICDAALKLMDVRGINPVIESSMSTAALVSYARPFSSGVRHLAKPDISVFNGLGDAPKAHQHFLDLRNKYVAHSVNAHEQNIVHAVLDQPPNEPKLLGVRNVNLTSDPLDRQGFTTMRQMAQLLRDQATREVDRLSKLVEKEVAALNIAHLYSKEPFSVRMPDVESAGLSRVKGRKE